MAEKKAFATFEEWWTDLDWTEGWEAETYAREAWKQALRSARVQEIILKGELDSCYEKAKELEGELVRALDNISYLEEVVREEMK